MTLPNYSQIFHGVFPDATEVETIKAEGNFESGWVVQFDPQKCTLTPSGWDLVQKIGHKFQKISYNPESNVVEVHIQ